LILSQIEVKETLVRFTNAGIAVTSYGNVSLGLDEGNDRRILSFCRNAGFRVVTADLDLERVPAVDRLAQEYEVRVAIQNRGPAPPERTCRGIGRAVLTASRWMGLCIDTAACLVSGEDPAAAIRAAPERAFGLHLRDAERLGAVGWREVPLGAGALNLREILEELVARQWRGFLSLAPEVEDDEPATPVLESFTGFLTAAKSVRRQRL
jgi:sugar phosphate isomerase/epimerase